MAVYGMAVGALWATLKSEMGLKPGPRGPIIIDTVDERTWTKGVPKRTRQRRIGFAFPAYANVMAVDSGGDVADAIGLCLWWWAKGAGAKITNHELRNTKERQG